MFIEGFCHGNLVQNDVYEICNIFKNLFSSRQLDKECRHHESVLCLPAGANFVRSTTVKNKLEGNSVVEVMHLSMFLITSYSTFYGFHYLCDLTYLSKILFAAVFSN